MVDVSHAPTEHGRQLPPEYQPWGGDLETLRSESIYPAYRLQSWLWLAEVSGTKERGQLQQRWTGSHWTHAQYKLGTRRHHRTEDQLSISTPCIQWQSLVSKGPEISYITLRSSVFLFDPMRSPYFIFITILLACLIRYISYLIFHSSPKIHVFCLPIFLLSGTPRWRTTINSCWERERENPSSQGTRSLIGYPTANG